MEYPLVFVHGAGDNARAWQEQQTFFGTRAYTLDLPGHGTRPDTLPEQASVADYARAVWTIVSQELRLERPIMVGHSLGGLIALQMGLDYGAQLGGLVLIGTGARMRVAPHLLEMARLDPEQGWRALRHLSMTHQDDARAAGDIAREESSELLPGILYRDLLACNTFDVMDRLEQFQGLPVLILCGAEERNAPVKFSKYLHEHVAGSQLQIIEGASHYVQREKAEETNQAIATWLKAQGK